MSCLPISAKASKKNSNQERRGWFQQRKLETDAKAKMTWHSHRVSEVNSNRTKSCLSYVCQVLIHPNCAGHIRIGEYVTGTSKARRLTCLANGKEREVEIQDEADKQLFRLLADLGFHARNVCRY